MNNLDHLLCRGAVPTVAIRLLVAMIFAAGPSLAQQKEFTKWPAGSSPKETGKRVAEHFAAGPHTNFNRSTPPQRTTYPETVAWCGTLTFAELSGDRDLIARLISRFDLLLAAESSLVPLPTHVDYTVFASVPLEIAIETKQGKYLNLGLEMANKQWEDPTPDGLTTQSRFWIAGMYIITLVQV